MVIGDVNFRQLFTLLSSAREKNLLKLLTPTLEVSSANAVLNLEALLCIFSNLFFISAAALQRNEMKSHCGNGNRQGTEEDSTREKKNKRTHASAATAKPLVEERL